MFGNLQQTNPELVLPHFKSTLEARHKYIDKHYNTTISCNTSIQKRRENLKLNK